MGNVTDNQCDGRMDRQEKSLGREIGLVRTTAKEAKDCAGKKLEKGTFRWAFGVLIFVLGGILVTLFGLSIFNGRANASTENTVAAMVEKVGATKEKVDGLDRDLRDFRAEQREDLQEIKDLVQKNH